MRKPRAVIYLIVLMGPLLWLWDTGVFAQNRPPMEYRIGPRDHQRSQELERERNRRLSASRLTVDKLKNAEYRSSMWKIGTIRLNNGTYRNEKEFVSMWLGEHVAFGDLNGDGAEDAAVELVSSGGGSNADVELVAVINHNGTPRQADVHWLGGNTEVKRLSIRSGRIVVDRMKHGPNDPHCCPSLRVTEEYGLRGGRLSRLR